MNTEEKVNVLFFIGAIISFGMWQNSVWAGLFFICMFILIKGYILEFLGLEYKENRNPNRIPRSE